MSSSCTSLSGSPQCSRVAARCRWIRRGIRWRSMSGDVSSKGRRNTVRHGRHSIGEEQEESEAWPQMHKHSKSICSVKLRSRGDEGDVPFEVFHESSTQAKNLKRDVTLVT